MLPVIYPKQKLFVPVSRPCADVLVGVQKKNRKGCSQKNRSNDYRISNIDPFRHIINLYQNGERNNQEENKGKPFDPFAL